MRLFVALELPGAVRRELAVWTARAAPPGVRAVAEENLHLTLAFLGERPAQDAAAAAAVLPAAARPVDELSTAGALWLPPRRPGVLCVALAPDPGLAALRTELVAGLAGALDWIPERRAFRPHVTVGRVRRGARVRGAELEPPPPDLAFAARIIALYRSHPGPGGSRYEALARAVLG